MSRKYLRVVCPVAPTRPTRLRADATLGVARGRVDLVLRLVPGLVLRLGPDCGHVDDSEEEGLPELAYEGTASLSERAEEK